MKVRSHAFLHKKRFYKQHQAEIGKKEANAKQHPEDELLLLDNYLHSSSDNRTYRKKSKRLSVSVFIRLYYYAMKIIMKIRNRSHRYDINEPRSRHGNKQ